MAQILLTNDDGVYSPGLAAAAKALRDTGALKVIAPLRQQTAMGRAQTGDPQARLVPCEIALDTESLPAFSCDASPAACVGHGLRVLHTYKPDLVVSGINYGENLGANITSSGTVGAAIEAAVRGIPSIAISLETHIDSHYEYSAQDWGVAMHFLRYFAHVVVGKGLPHDVHVLKIDVPADATCDTPWRLTRLALCTYYESHIVSPTLDSMLRDARVSKTRCENASADSDVYALGKDKVVSVTPLSLDLTTRADFDSLCAWMREP